VGERAERRRARGRESERECVVEIAIYMKERQGCVERESQESKRARQRVIQRDRVKNREAEGRRQKFIVLLSQ